MRGMRDRALRVCDPSSKPKELQHLDEVFQANGFPSHLVKKTLTASQISHTLKIWSSPNHEGPCTPLTSVDSVRDLKGYVLLSTSAINVFTTANTLIKAGTNVSKSRVPEEKEKGIVYQVPCKDCVGVYTGEFKRTLKVI